MGAINDNNIVFHHRGFLLLKQPNQTWLVRPKKSPMSLLPFRTSNCSLEEVKRILERKLSEDENINQAA